MTVQFTYNNKGNITIRQVKSMTFSRGIVSLTLYDYYSITGSIPSPEQYVINTSKPDVIKFDGVTDISSYD